LTNCTSQDFLAVFGCPYQVVLSVIHRVRCSSECHIAILTYYSTAKGLNRHRAGSILAHSSPPQADGAS
jgi:hypothetical protein